MALTSCPECRGQVSTTLTQCPHCGKAIGVWGSCPECKGAITSEQESCRGCGFPLRAPKNAPAPAPPPPAASPQRGTTGRKKKRRKAGPLLEPGEEPPSAKMFAIAGLIVPLFAFLALAQSRKGGGARKLAWVGIALWIAATIFLFTRLKGAA